MHSMLELPSEDIISRYHRAVGIAPHPLGRDLPSLRSTIYGDRVRIDGAFWERAAATLREEVVRLRFRAWDERARQRTRYQTMLENDPASTYAYAVTSDVGVSDPVGASASPPLLPVTRVVVPSAPSETVAFFAPWTVREHVAMRRGTEAALNGLSDEAAQRELMQVLAAPRTSHYRDRPTDGESDENDDEAQYDAAAAALGATSTGAKPSHPIARYAVADADCLDASAIAAALGAVGAPAAISTAAHLMFILPRGEYLVRPVFSDKSPSRRRVAVGSGSDCAVTIDGAALIVGAVRCAIHDALDAAGGAHRGVGVADGPACSHGEHACDITSSLARASSLTMDGFVPPEVAAVAASDSFATATKMPRDAGDVSAPMNANAGQGIGLASQDRVAVTLSYARRPDSAHSRGSGRDAQPVAPAPGAALRRATTPPPRAPSGSMREGAASLAAGNAGVLPTRRPTAQRMVPQVPQTNNQRQAATPQPRATTPAPLRVTSFGVAVDRESSTRASRARSAPRHHGPTPAYQRVGGGPSAPESHPQARASLPLLVEPASTLSELYRTTATQRRLDAAAVKELPLREQQRVTLQQRTAEWQRVQQQRGAIGGVGSGVSDSSVRPRAKSAGAIIGVRNLPAGSQFSTASLAARAGGGAPPAAASPTGMVSRPATANATPRPASPRRSLIPQSPPPIPATPAALSRRFPVVDGGAHAALMRARQLRSDGFDRFLSRYTPRKSLVTEKPHVALSHRAQGGVAVAISSTELTAPVVAASAGATLSRSSSRGAVAQRCAGSPVRSSSRGSVPRPAFDAQGSGRTWSTQIGSPMLQPPHRCGANVVAVRVAVGVSGYGDSTAATSRGPVPLPSLPVEADFNPQDLEGGALREDEVVVPLSRGSLFCRSSAGGSAVLLQMRDARSFLYNS